MSDRAARAGTWAAAIVLLAAALANCAAAPMARPAVAMPPAEMWPACAAGCIAQGSVFLGVLGVTADGPFVCACGTKPAAPEREGWEGPT